MPHAIFPPGIESQRILFSAQNAILKRQLVNCAKYAPSLPSLSLSSAFFQCSKMSIVISLKQQQQCVQHNWQLFLFLFLFLIFFLGVRESRSTVPHNAKYEPKNSKKRKANWLFFYLHPALGNLYFILFTFSHTLSQGYCKLRESERMNISRQNLIE